jgi:hypothetical protein
VFTVVAGVATAVGTFVYHSQDQRNRAIDQEVRAKDQLSAIKRELQRPYEEKKLNLYRGKPRELTKG